MPAVAVAMVTIAIHRVVVDGDDDSSNDAADDGDGDNDVANDRVHKCGSYA